MAVFDFDRAIVRQPSPSVVDALRSGDQDAPSFAGIWREHAAYIDALRAAGLSVITLPPLVECPDSLFVEDPALVFPEMAILLRSAAPSRVPEAAELGICLREEFPVVLELTRGHVDGGDVLVMPDEVLVGLSTRTNESGASALVELLAQAGTAGRIVRTPDKTLHLKTAASLIDEDTVLATAELAATGIFAGYRVLPVAAGEEPAANVLRVNDVVLAGSTFPRTLDMLVRHGSKTVPLSVREIGKIDAGLTCMSLRWRSAISSRPL